MPGCVRNDSWYTESFPHPPGKDVGALISNVGSGAAATASAAPVAAAAEPAKAAAKEDKKEDKKEKEKPKVEEKEESDDDMGFGKLAYTCSLGNWCFIPSCRTV